MTRETIDNLVLEFLTDPHNVNGITRCPTQRRKSKPWRAAPKSRMTRAMYGYQGS